MSWARIQFERKQVNRVLVRCKNTKHNSQKARVQKKDERKLQNA
jgi:hypothetical protein